MRLAVETGRLNDSSDAIREAMDLWVDRERRRLELVATLDSADASIKRGEGVPLTSDSLNAVVGDIMNRHRFSD